MTPIGKISWELQKYFGIFCSYQPCDVFLKETFKWCNIEKVFVHRNLNELITLCFCRPFRLIMNLYSRPSLTFFLLCLLVLSSLFSRLLNLKCNLNAFLDALKMHFSQLYQKWLIKIKLWKKGATISIIKVYLCFFEKLAGLYVGKWLKASI